MPRCHLHQIGFTLPAGLSAADLPQLVAELFSIYGLDPAAVKQPAGRHGYAESYSLRTEHGAEIISILCRPRSRHSPDTTHIAVHGAALESGNIDVPHLCREIMARHGWGTDVHLAADDTDGILPWADIMACSAADTWTDRVTTTTCRPRKNPKTGEMEDCPPTYLRSTGETIYYGQSDSDLSVCMYTRRGPVRVETRIRNRAAATEIIRRISGGEDIGTITAGILRRNLKFHVAGTRRKDRRPVCPWWARFIGDAEQITLPRTRDPQHRSPWYVPPTTADKVSKYVTRFLAGESRADVLDCLRAIVAEESAADATDAFGEDAGGNGPYDYVSPISTPQPESLVLSGVTEIAVDVSPISSHVSSVSTFDPATFCPEITF